MKINFSKLLLALFILSAASLAQAAWNEPPIGTVPPNNNTPEPINVGDSTQNKSGRLGVGALSVFGDLLIPSGASAGYVLTSNSVGKATWEPLGTIPSGGGPGPAGSAGSSGESFWRKMTAATGNFLAPQVQTDHLGLWPQTNLGSGKKYGCSGCNASNEIQLYNGSGNMNFSVGSASNKFIFSGGPVQITAGNPGAGKVLTSDASGNASWQVPSGGSGGGAPSGGPSSDVLPAGTVIMTRNSSCPSGWFEPGEFAGRFIIASDLSHPPGTTTGTPRTGADFSKSQDAEGLPLFGTPVGGGVGTLHSHVVPSIALKFCVKQ